MDAVQILDNAATACLWFEADGRLVYLNPAAEDLLGLSLLAPARPDAETLFTGAPALLAAWRQAREGGGRVSLREISLPLPARDAGARLVDCILTPVGAACLVELSPRERPRRIRDEQIRHERQLAARGLGGAGGFINKSTPPRPVG
jgi:nitrogen-specific signal transduction histidine kinase